MESAVKNCPALDKQEIVIDQPTNVYYCSIPLFLARTNNVLGIFTQVSAKEARVPIPMSLPLFGLCVSVYGEGEGGRFCGGPVSTQVSQIEIA